MGGEPSFFTIGVRDPATARTFCGALFGWTFTDPPSGTGAVIEGATVPGGIHGEDPGACPSLFFAVADIETALDRVRDLGGQVLEHDPDDDPATVARFGRFALCTDDQGSGFGLHQPPPE